MGVGGEDGGVSLTCPFLTFRVRSAHLVPEGKMAPKARKVAEVRMVTQVLWDPQGRRYVTQGALPLPGDGLSQWPQASGLLTLSG